MLFLIYKAYTCFIKIIFFLLILWNFLLCCCYVNTKFRNITSKVEQIQRIQVFSVHAVGVSRKWFLWICTVLLATFSPTAVFGQSQRQQPKSGRFFMFTWLPHNRNPIAATVVLLHTQHKPTETRLRDHIQNEKKGSGDQLTPSPKHQTADISI